MNNKKILTEVVALNPFLCSRGMEEGGGGGGGGGGVLEGRWRVPWKKIVWIRGIWVIYPSISSIASLSQSYCFNKAKNWPHNKSLDEGR